MKQTSMSALLTVLMLAATVRVDAAQSIQDVLSACPRAAVGFSLETQAQALISQDPLTSQDLANSFAMRAKSANIWSDCARGASDPLLHDAAMVEALGNRAMSSTNIKVVSKALSALKALSKNSKFAVVREGAAQFAAKTKDLLQVLQSQH